MTLGYSGDIARLDDRTRFGDDSIGWPSDYPTDGMQFWATQLLQGLRKAGVLVEIREFELHPGSLLLAQVRSDGGSQLIAVDATDRPEIETDVARNVLVYFKFQFASEGYDEPNVVPGGYTLANHSGYRYLPLARALRSLRLFKYDVYGRFGLLYGGAEIRKRAVELIAARDDLRHEVSLFKYPGGPAKSPYRTYLFEIARAKVCVDLPGGGDLYTRLVDYLAVGACVVAPPPRVGLPVKLVDGEQIVYCAPDLSDLPEICAELVRDDDERERIARNARVFFDRYLTRRQLGAYYISKIVDARDGSLEPETGRVGRPWWRPRSGSLPVKYVAAAAVAALALFVALPEALGDKPYDPQPTEFLHKP